MKLVLSLILCVFELFCFGLADINQYPHLMNNIKSSVSQEDQQSAVRDLVERIVGDRSRDFTVEVGLPVPNTGKDIVQIEGKDGKVKIIGSSGVGVAFGFNHYLKYYCNKQMSWSGDNLAGVPNPLPDTKGTVTLDAGVKFRYYQNVCTVSYSFVWWNWTRWEREIDWMAINGINLPLAFNGQEALYRRVFKKLNCTDSDMNAYFTGPAFLAWGRMGNLEKWGGPLPISWMNNQLALQHKILLRMRSLGMTPVLPAFSGFIPYAITKLYKVSYSRSPEWSHFNCSYSCTYLLDPSDPMFKTIGKMFIEEQMMEYNGTDHVYSGDMFNEMSPKSSNPDYIKSTSAGMFESMVSADDQAVWLMQGWLFRSDFWQPPQEKALLTGVPQGRMLVLDLFSEASEEYTPTHSYYGQPFIWCMLHNFGGNTGFYGRIQTINEEPAAALAYPNSTMVGTGLTPEGINQNYFIYELMIERGFYASSTNLTQWVVDYVKRRYGSDSPGAIAAWLHLAATAYNDTGAGYPIKRSIRGPIVDRPTTNLPIPPRWYDQKELISVWSKFMSSLKDLPNIDTVRHDTVDITRQVLQYLHFEAQHALVTALNNLDYEAASDAGAVMLAILDDMEEILLTNEHFLMGRWISDARNFGSDDKSKAYYEFNARNQVTLWGPTGNILDYASKQWAGLMAQYYRPRWAYFINRVLDCIRSETHFNHGKFSNDIFVHVEKPFADDNSTMPKDPIGDTKTVASNIYKRWTSSAFSDRTTMQKYQVKFSL